MPKIFVNTLDKAIFKIVDFLTFLQIFTEDLKIEESSKELRSVIFHILVFYNPICDTGHTKLQRK